MIVSVCLFAFFSFLFFSFLFFGEILGYYFKEFQDQGRENSLAPVGAFPLGRLIGFGDHHPSEKKKKEKKKKKKEKKKKEKKNRKSKIKNLL